MLDCCMTRLWCVYVVFFVFFKQKTAYEMRISDWSSDVCSSDLAVRRTRSEQVVDPARGEQPAVADDRGRVADLLDLGQDVRAEQHGHAGLAERSEERRVGKEGVRTCRSRG